ncbi:MAG: TIGR04076 family protein [Betaproteobacteria bacterium]
MYDLRVVVDEIRGFCDLPMKVGDYFEVSGGRITIPDGKFMCLWALQSILPMLPAKQRNIVEDNDWLSGTVRVTCPDPNGMVIFRIERVGEPACDAKGKERAGHRGGRMRGEPGPRPRMLVNERVCAGCRACELICSFTHERKFSDLLSRIHVHKVDEDGIDRPMVCRQCGNARCVEACPNAALSRDPETRHIVVDEARCTKCGLCAEACPFGAVVFHPSSGVPLICDLCGGDPECVKRCPTGAISYGLAGARQVGGRQTDEAGSSGLGSAAQ